MAKGNSKLKCRPGSVPARVCCIFAPLAGIGSISICSKRSQVRLRRHYWRVWWSYSRLWFDISCPLRIKRHGALCNVLLHNLMMDNAGVRREQTCSAQSNSRPGDIYHPDFLHGKLDVSVRNSFHLAYTVKSAVQPGSAAEAGEIEKDSRHDSDVSSCGGLFYPLVIETFGIWSPQSLETLKIIARKCSIMSSISISEATSNLHELRQYDFGNIT